MMFVNGPQIIKCFHYTLITEKRQIAHKIHTPQSSPLFKIAKNSRSSSPSPNRRFTDG